MTCDAYRRWWLGEMTDAGFAAHRADCEACRAALALDERIEAESRLIAAPAPAPELWDRIAAEIRAEDARAARGPAARGLRVLLPSRRRPAAGGGSRRGAWSLAAVLALAVGLGYALLLRPAGPPPRPRTMLTEEALARVEAIEDQYRQALADLETLAAPLLASADTELMLRYRERLETIDAQIRRCQAMLAGDDTNAHVRRYLLAAYQDKRKTLTDVIALAEASPPRGT